MSAVTGPLSYPPLAQSGQMMRHHCPYAAAIPFQLPCHSPVPTMVHPLIILWEPQFAPIALFFTAGATLTSPGGRMASDKEPGGGGDAATRDGEPYATKMGITPTRQLTPEELAVLGLGLISMKGR